MPIDHLAFPHIIDAIWANMTMAGIAEAGRVCSAWRTRANQILQRHLIAKFRGTEALILSVKCLEECPPRLPRYPLPLEHREYDCIVRQTPKAREVMRNMRTCDIDPKTATVLGNIGLRWDAQPTTYRVHLNHRGGAFMFSRGSAVCFFRTNNRTRIAPSDTERLVMNVRQRRLGMDTLRHFRKRPMALHQRIHFDFLVNDMELVVVFHSTRRADRRQFSCEYTLCEYLGGCWMRVRCLVLVGLERYFRSEKAYRRFQARAIAVMDGLGKHCVRILTCEEYEELVGTDTYRLYTVM